MAPLRIIGHECDPYLKVNISSCPCRSPSLLSFLLRYRWWPWQHLIANNIHLNKPFHPVKTLTNLISLEKGGKKDSKGEVISYFSSAVSPNKWKHLLKVTVTQFMKFFDIRCFRREMIKNVPTQRCIIDFKRRHCKVNYKTDLLRWNTSTHILQRAQIIGFN